MNSSVSIKRSVQVAALTVAFTASGSAMALAGTGPSTSGNHSILGGNQIAAPISVPVSVCGNALALLGDAFGVCQGGASVSGGSGGGSATTSGNHSIGGGNQVSVPVSVPVDVCGVSVAVLGHAASGCQGGASTGGAGGSGGGKTSGTGSIGGGNQVGIPISVPVSVCGISIGVLGNATSGCQGGSHTGTPPGHHHPTPPPCHHHHTPPPCHHHHGTPPRHHHGGSGATVSSQKLPPSASVTGASSLPTTGANFLGLLALAGGVITAGAGAMVFAAKRGLLHGLLAVTRRAAAVR